ncbi:LuxR C-terminal-related transcriptional regulator [Cryptosporangium sp. NPDC051539]|uniref:response regulator transcription factor n=1 Tax=Cryptosporangium sp. NPDC051539 TaxID=3363962 RepID=UPI0037A7A68D
MVTVDVVDDHAISRWGLQRALDGAGDIEVTGLFGAVGELKASWCRFPAPDVVVLDLYLADDLPCVDVVADLSRLAPVLTVSASRRPGDVAVCRGAGARGFVHKGSSPETLVAAVRSIQRGGLFFHGYDEPEPAATTLSNLSPRERQVLAYIAAGYTHEQAARRMGVSRHTVDTYVKRLRAKVGDGNKAHLTRMALLANVSVDPDGT